MPRILIVDNDANMRKVLELVLASKDRHVDSVDSGQPRSSGQVGGTIARDHSAARPG